MLLEEGNKSVATALDRAKATYNIIDQLSNQGIAAQGFLVYSFFSTLLGHCVNYFVTTTLKMANEKYSDETGMSWNQNFGDM